MDSKNVSNFKTYFLLKMNSILFDSWILKWDNNSKHISKVSDWFYIKCWNGQLVIQI